MIIHKKKRPRKFCVSKKNKIFLKDVGKIHLNEDELLTIVSNNKKNYEICRKDWGYYATPSLNFRLKKNGFRTILAKQKKKFFILLIDIDKLKSFKQYAKIENYKIIKRLDNLK